MKGNNMKLKNLPKKEEVKTYWKSILQDDTKFNENLERLSDLEKSYHKYVKSPDYNISQSTINISQ